MRLNEPHSFLIKNTCSVCAATKPELSAGVRKYLEWLARGFKGKCCSRHGYCKVTSDVPVWHLRSLEILPIKLKSSYLLWVLLNLDPRWSLLEVNLQSGILWLSVSNSLVLLHEK